ncbi:hypothetical protein [Ekhidna sp.]|uniref:hypothetical protein n=1 Tax=Ekhidna sp. TaxID=2608089 RepID=UPI003BA8856C
MRYFLYIFLVSLLVVSCQIEDDNAPAPDEAFIKYYGELSSYEASDIEIVYEAGLPVGLVVFGSVVSDFGDKDYYVLRTDLDGNLINSTSFGYSDTLDIDDEPGADDWTGDDVRDRFRADETAGQIQYVTDIGDGSPGYAIVGTSSITINALQVSDWKRLTFGLLSTELEPRTFNRDTLFARSARTADELLDFEGKDVIELSVNPGILVVGSREFDRGGGDSDFDNYFIKVDLVNETIIFEETQGIVGDDEDDQLIRGFEKTNGNLVMIGTSNTPSLLGENGGDNGTNVFYLETDPNGTPFNSAAYGLEDPTNAIFDDFASDAIKSSSGFSIVGTSSTSANQEFGFLINLSNNGVYLSGNSHDSSVYQDHGGTTVASIETRGIGVTQALDNKIIMVGQYPSFSFTDASNVSYARSAEGMFAKFGQGGAHLPAEESFFGLADGNDEIVDAVTLPDGKIVAVANVDFGGGVKLISIIKLNADGSLD